MAIKSKRILLITSEFPPLPGGIGNHAFLLSKYLIKLEYNVSVLTDYRSLKEDNFFDANQNFKIVRVKRNIFTYLNRFLKSISLIKDSDIIIASGKFSLWLSAILSQIFKNKKYVAVLHGSEIKAGNKILQKFTKWSLTQFHDLIAVSNFTKEFALSVNPNLKITVINNGIEIESLTEEKSIPKSLQLITVGNVTYRKGQQNVIKALPLLKEFYTDIHYHCIGIPTKKEDFLELAEQLNVQNLITFHGKLNNTEKHNLLKNASIFIMLSDKINNDFEGFGIAILEANAMGLPAIGSYNSGIADAIKNNFSGILVDPHKEDEILLAIQKIIKSYKNYSSNAKVWSLQFNWTNIIKQYVKRIEI